MTSGGNPSTMAQPSRSRKDDDAHVDDLLGRDSQTQALTAALQDTTRTPRTILIEGDPGIGKTALFAVVLAKARATGYRVLEARPVEAEMGLALAGLGDLLAPALADLLPSLPDPQRHALEVALLLRDGDSRPPDQRALGLAVLHGVQALASVEPVLLAIDDAQWLDATSAALLRFALRRLREEPVLVLLARRPEIGGGLDASGLPSVDRIGLGPLSPGAIHALVGGRLGLGLSRPLLRRVHGLSGGNPFYALELARGLRDGSLRLDPGEAIAPDLGSIVGERIGHMPRRSRETLAMAAAAARPTIALLQAAQPGKDVPAALAPAVRLGIVHVHAGDIRFVHPLLASAALGALGEGDRRACHARLAVVVEDRVERARHQALAATGPDAVVAAQVDEAARLTRARGAASDAADLMALAVRLTGAGERPLGHRRLVEAEYRLEAGDAPGASELLEGLVTDTPAGPGRAIVLARLAHVHNLAADTAGGVGLLRQALEEAAPDDPITGEVHESLAWALLLARQDLAEALEHAIAATQITSTGNDPASLALSLGLEALVRTLLGQPSDAIMERALELEPPGAGLSIRNRPMHANGYRLTCLDELDAAEHAYVQLLARAEEQGDESAPSHLLGRRSVVRMLQGDLVTAERLAAEAVELSEQTGQLPTQAAAIGRLALIVARQGDLDRATRLAGRGLDLASQPSVATAASTTPWTGRPHARGGESALWTLGHVALCQGRATDAVGYLTALSDPVIGCGVREPGDMRWLTDEVEALVLAGQVEQARQRTRLLIGLAEGVGRPSAWAAALMASGLLDAAEGRLGAALTRLEAAASHAERAPLPFERGRVLLALARVQRRLAHKRDARTTLDAAIGSFEGIGARHWAGVAWSELGRIGGRSSSGAEVTESERRVIELVARGLSNKEVAQALFVTPKAVEASLSRIFLKRGVRSRTELAALVVGEVGHAAAGYPDAKESGFP